MTLLLAVPEGVEALGADIPQTEPVGVIPGDDVALHRIHLIETSPRRRAAEARMRATDLAAQPIEELHVALGEPEPDGACWLALIDRERMAGHLAHFRTAGVDPVAIVPAALLLPPPKEDAVDGVSAASLGPLTVVRGHDFAASVEPELAATLAPGVCAPAPLRSGALAPATLDLRQGAFAPPIKWWTLRWVRVSGALLVTLALVLAMVPMLIEQRRATDLIASHDEMTMSLAERALGTRPTDAAAAATALHTARLQTEQSAVAPRLALAARILDDNPATRLAGVSLQPDGTLALTLGGPADAIEAATAAFHAQQAFQVEARGLQVRLGSRREPSVPVDASALGVAEGQVIRARHDAAILLAHRRNAPAGNGQTDPVQIARAALSAAGLVDIDVRAENGATLALPAVRSAILLPMLADIEARGGRVQRLEITPNRDLNVAAEMVIIN